MSDPLTDVPYDYTELDRMHDALVDRDQKITKLEAVMRRINVIASQNTDPSVAAVCLRACAILAAEVLEETK